MPHPFSSVILPKCELMQFSTAEILRIKITPLYLESLEIYIHPMSCQFIL